MMSRHAGVEWILTTLILAAAVVLLALARLPVILTRIIVRRFGKRIGKVPWNELQRAHMPEAGSDVVRGSSPDLMYMLGAFDARREPVRLRCFVPDWESYWSISLYAWNTDNFYVLTRHRTNPGEHILVISARGRTPQPKPCEITIVAPTTRGLIIIRAAPRSRADAAEIAQVRESLHRTRISRYSDTVERQPN